MKIKVDLIGGGKTGPECLIINLTAVTLGEKSELANCLVLTELQMQDVHFHNPVESDF